MDLLLIDDDRSIRRTMRVALESMGHHVAEAPDRGHAVRLLAQERFDLAFLDLRLGRDSGLDVIPELLAQDRELAIVVVTAFASVETAVEAMRRGAIDYLPKPFTPDLLRLVLGRAGEVRRLKATAADLQERLDSGITGEELETGEPSLQAVLAIAYRVAPGNTTLLLRGESGTGKNVLARAIHARSARAAGPFVTVHCPSLSAELLESALFGHVRGAFTGAVADVRGKVATAAGGTLFLDEVGDLPAPLQPKLLRLVQEKAYERVGDPQTRSADVRIVAATNRNLEAEVAAGRFRQDLYYRLNVIDITLPPLRQRTGDILPLATRFLKEFAAQTGKAVGGFAPAAQEALRGHSWPGNVRELRNAVERGVLLAQGTVVEEADLPGLGRSLLAPPMELGGDVTLEDLEREHIRRVVARAASLEAAARILGIDPSTLYRKRKRSEQ